MGGFKRRGTRRQSFSVSQWGAQNGKTRPGTRSKRRPPRVRVWGIGEGRGHVLQKKTAGDRGGKKTSPEEEKTHKKKRG